jgi:hypothetical protein
MERMVGLDAIGGRSRRREVESLTSFYSPLLDVRKSISVEWLK